MTSSVGIIFAIFFVNHVKSDLNLGPNDLVGILPPVFATFDKNDKINLKVIPRYAEHLAKNGIPGVLVCGISGEGPVLTLEERIIFSDAWIAAAKQYKMQVILQIAGGNPFDEILKLAKYAESSGVDAISVLPDYYYRPSNIQELVYYLKLISLEAPNTPLFYLDDDYVTKVDLNMVMLFPEATRQIPSFCGIISDAPTCTQVAASTKLRPYQRIMAVPTTGVLSYLDLNRNGSVPTICNVFPKLCTKILKTAQSGRLLDALDLQIKLNERTLAATRYDGFEVYCFIPLLKEAMLMVTGIPMGEVRKPLAVVGCKIRKAIAQNYRDLGVKIVQERKCNIEPLRGVIGE